MEEKFKSALSAMETHIECREASDFEELLDCIEAADEVMEVSTSSLSLSYIPRGAKEMPNLSADTEQIEEFSNRGGYIASSDAGRFIILDDAVQLFANRAGISCELFKQFRRQERHEDIIELVNFGFSYAEPSDTSKIIVRANHLIGVFSEKYQFRDQRELFTTARDALQTRFPALRFVSAYYTHDYTNVVMSLGDYKESFMNAYRNAWVQSGRPESMLADIEPCVRITTSDAGKSSVTITALMRQQTRERQLSDKLPERHYGTINGRASIERKIDQCFSKMEQNYNRLAEMMSIYLDNPVNVMIGIMKRGSEKNSLVGTCKKACKQCLDNFKQSLIWDTRKRTAFDVYSALCEMEYSSSMNSIREDARMDAIEKIYRTIKLKDRDWAELDVPAVAEL